MNEKVKVRVYGVGCAKCIKAEEVVSEFFSHKNIPFEVEKVKDREEILNSGIIVTPAVELNGEVIFHGRLPRNKELNAWIEKQK